MTSLLERVTSALASRYRVEREISSGSTSSVYEAYSFELEKFVAIKVLRPELAAVIGVERFLREIETVAKLDHPNILPLLDSGEVGGLLYYVTPFVRDESLRQLLDRETRIESATAVRLACEIAGALAHAHEHAIVHRDIKPENILLDDGRALVADFGISRAIGQLDQQRLTETGLALGTPQYMSPEQSVGSGGIDGRSDIYSLGCVLYELIAGHPPFSGATPQEVLAHQIVDKPKRLRRTARSVSNKLDACVSCALEKDPALRFATCQEFAQALETPHLSPALRRLRARKRWRWSRWIGAALFAITAITLVAFHNRPLLKSRDWILIADFEGPPHDLRLASTVRELLTADLNESQFVRTLPRQALVAALRSASLPETTTINADLARELAFRSAVRGVVVGSIRAQSVEMYVLQISVIDAERGTTLLSVSAMARADSLPTVIQSLAGQLRRHFGEKEESIAADRSLLDITTPSLPAYRMYVDAIALKQRGDITSSNRVLHEALAVDTAFASAWALLGMNYADQRIVDSARLALSEALRRPDRMSDANRFRLQGDAAYAIDYDLQAAVERYRQFLQLTPQSIGGRNNLGLYLSLLGHNQEALAEFETSSNENPLGPNNAQASLLNEAAMLIALGHRDRAEAVTRELFGPFADDARLQLFNARGAFASADSLARGLSNDSRNPGWLRVDAMTSRISAAVARGDFVTARNLLTDADTATRSAQHHWFANSRSLLALMSHLTIPEVATLEPVDTSLGGIVAKALRVDPKEHMSESQSLLLLVLARSKADSARLGQAIPLLRARLDASAGNWSAVIARLSPLARAGEHDAVNLDRVPAIWSRWLVADAYAHQLRPDSALAYLRLVVADTGLAPGHLALRGLAMPFATMSMAQQLERAGESDKAREKWVALDEQLAHSDRLGRALWNEARTRLGKPH